MKFIKSIVLLVLITLLNSIPIKKVEKKVTKATNKSKDAGTGNWNDGLTCASILIAKDSADLVSDGNGKFYPTKLENPTLSLDKFGWAFEMGSIGDTLKKVMIQEGNSNRWYIPYRYINKDLDYTSASDGKYLEAWLKNDDKESYHLRVNLPNISDSDANKIKNFVNTARVSHSNTISRSKTAATLAAGEYFTNKPLYDAAVTTGNNISQAKSDAETQKTNISTNIQNQQTSLNGVETDIANLESQLTAQRTSRATVQSNMLSLNSQISAINDTLNALGTDTSVTQAQLTEMGKNVSAALNNLDKQLTILREEAPNRETEINNARAAVIAIKIEDFSSNLNKITP